MGISTQKLNFKKKDYVQLDFEKRIGARWWKHSKKYISILVPSKDQHHGVSEQNCQGKYESNQKEKEKWAFYKCD